MPGGCCPPTGLRKIRVGNFIVGVTGLDALLEDTLGRGWRPGQEGLREALVQGLRAAGNYIASGSEGVYGEALAELYWQYFHSLRKQAPATGQRQQGGVMKIEILGPGCARCRATEEVVRKAVAELKLDARVEHITDPVEFARRGVMLTPGVVIDGQVKSSGRVPALEEAKSWLAPRAA
jgi:small redox-active disulfide protein 2